MNKEDVVEFIKTEWTKNPLGDVTENATSTISGIEQQLNLGMNSILWMCKNQDGSLQIKMLKIE